MASIPKKATTVILLREETPEGFEVFLLKRHEKSSFMGGNFVYPGGRVDPEDGSLEMCHLCEGITPEEAHVTFGGSMPPDLSFGHYVAGIRELFEEAGVLLAYDRAGNLFEFKSQTEKERFSGYRDLLQEGKLTLFQLAQAERLVLALDRLHYYAHWITPEARSERFDTRFFLTCHPAGQEASYDQKETMVGIWLTPKKALEENLEGKVTLSPPTLKTLENLSQFKAASDVFSSLKKGEIRPVLPILTKISADPLILFPWDPEYEIFQRGEIPTQIDHGKPSQLGDNTTRLILKEGRWLPFCRPQ